MTYNYHHHDYGLGRTLSRAFWVCVALVVAWWVVVLVMSFPWILLICAIIIGAAIVVRVSLPDKRRTP
jgi:Flp pilus assembly protein TadB